MFAFVKSVFSEEGQGSYSRCASAAITLSVIGWISHVVFKTHAIPDLTGPSAFITAGVGSHYLVNKAPDIIDSVKGNGHDSQHDQQQQHA